MNETKRDETILGVDYGETNVGLAFGRNGLVSPIRTVSGKNVHEAIGEINKTAIQNHCARVIIGLPLNYDNRETAESRKVRHFTNLLKVFLKAPIEFENEYGSSKESFEEALRMGIPQKRRRVIDHFSAAMILKNYYERSATPQN